MSEDSTASTFDAKVGGGCTKTENDKDRNRTGAVAGVDQNEQQRRQQQSINGSASNSIGGDGSKRCVVGAAVDTPANVFVVDAATQRQLNRDAIVQGALRRTQYFFPGLEIPDRWAPPRRKYNQQSPEYELKCEIWDRIFQRLNAMDGETRKRLMMRENAEECCLALGMNKEVVKIKFEALRCFEKELGITGKTPILHSISHLIGSLDLSNIPDRHVNDCIEDGYLGNEWLSYMGVGVKPKSLLSVIEMVQNTLDEKELGDAIMRGTSASGLQRIYAPPLYRDNSDETHPLGGHDFGPGVYCFKGHLARSLSFAFDRSWPKPKLGQDIWDERLDIAQVTRDNPAVVIYPKARIPVNDCFFRVGVDPYPYNEEELSEMFKPSYKKYKEKQQQWEHIETPELQKWMHFVKIARFYKEVPESHVFYGLLHDCNTMEETNQSAQPCPDKDGWDQYCFATRKGNLHLRQERLFIEFFIDWKDWAGAEVDK